MARALVLLFVSLFVPCALSGSSVGIASREDGFATDPPRFGRERGWQSISDLEIVGDVAFVTWYDFDSPQPRGMISRVSYDGTLLDPIGIPAGGFSTLLVPEGDGVRMYWIAGEDSRRFLRTSTVSRDGLVGPVVEVLELPPEPSHFGVDVAQNETSDNLLVAGPWAVLMKGATVVRQVDLGGWGDEVRIERYDHGWIVAWVASGGFAMWTALDEDLSVTGTPGGMAVSDGVSSIDIASDGESFIYALSGQIGLDVWVVDPVSENRSRIVELDLAFVSPVVERLASELFLIAWNVNGGIEGAELDAGKIGMAHVLLEDGGFGFRMQDWNGKLLVADSPGGCVRTTCEFDARVTLLNGSRTAPVILSGASVRQTSPSIASSGNTFLACWLEREPEPIIAWGLSRNGARFDVREVDPEKLVDPPVVARGIEGWLILWSTFSLVTYSPTVEGLILDENGAPMSTIEISLDSMEAETLSVAHVPLGWVVAGIGARGEVFVQRLGHDGTKLGEPLMVGGPSNYPLHLGLGVVNDAVILLWSQRDDAGRPWELKTASVSSSGQVSSGNVIFESGGSILQPSLDCQAGRCFAVWSSGSSLGDSFDVFGRALDPASLTAASPVITIASSPRLDSNAQLAWSGLAWIVSWTDRHPDSGDQVVRAVRIDTNTFEPSAPGSLGQSTFSGVADHALSCGESNCLSLRVVAVDDTERGRTMQLMRTFVLESRPRGVRRCE